MEQLVYLGKSSHLEPGFAMSVKLFCVCGGKNWGSEKLHALLKVTQGLVVEMELELRLG